MLNRYYKYLILFLLIPSVCFGGSLINSFSVDTDTDSISLDTSNALATNIALCYVFKDGSGTTVSDLTSNNNDGTLNNATWDTSVPHGAIDLSQSSSYVSTGSQVIDNTMNTYSIMVFLRTPSTLDSQGCVFDHENGASWRTIINSDTGISFETRIDGDSTLDSIPSNTSLTADTDTKIVVTFDGTANDVKKIYIDGTLDRTESPTAHGAGNAGTGDKTWLGYNSDGHNFTGKIYAVYVWTGRVLSQSDVNSLQTDAYTMINGVSE